jgi:glycerol uptake facilitator-like aquaporin
VAEVAPISRRIVSEAIGTAFLLAAIVGSGIMGETLAGGNIAVALLANTIATGAALVALILTFGPVSGAHFNPVVTLTAAWHGEVEWRHVGALLGAQVTGALAGVAAAHFMFHLPMIETSRHMRQGSSMVFSEFVATFGLVMVIRSCARSRPGAVPFAVGAYITAAYWFTASTGFANPAVTLARACTDTFSGIRPTDVAGFIAAQLAGAGSACALLAWLAPAKRIS